MWLRKASTRAGPVLGACALAAVLATPALDAGGKEPAADTLLIGTSGSLTGGKAKAGKEKAALETLKSFIKDETGMNDEIVQQKDWRELADKMVRGKLHLGVFQGCEFAWASAKHPELKPLGLAVNVYVYPIAYVVAKRGDRPTDFAGLKGQSLSVPDTGQDFLRLFVDARTRASGKPTREFFSKITTPHNVEDAIDDVVDGKVGATVVDRAALEAYKARKSGRFGQLQEVARSKPFPPGIVAYYNDNLDAAKREKFLRGLLNASRNEKGKMMLALFHLTGFAKPAADFDAVLARLRKDYPEPKTDATK